MESCVSVWVNCSLLNRLKKIEAGQLVSLRASPASLLSEGTWHPPSSEPLLKLNISSQWHSWHSWLDNPSLWGAVLFTVACLEVFLGATHWMPVASPHPVLAIEYVPGHWQMSPENHCYSCPACLAHSFPKDPYFYLLASFKSQCSSYSMRLLWPHYWIMQIVQLLTPLPLSTY